MSVVSKKLVRTDSAGDATDVWPGHPDYRAHPTTPAIAYPVDLHHEKWLEDGTHSHEIIFDKNGTHSVDVISDAAAQMGLDDAMAFQACLEAQSPALRARFLLEGVQREAERLARRAALQRALELEAP